MAEYESARGKKIMIEKEPCPIKEPSPIDSKPEEISCQESPSHTDFTKPDFPDKAYYSKVPKDQLEQLIGDKIKAENEADEVINVAYAHASELLQSAKAEYEAAKRKKNHDSDILDLKCKNKKTALFQDYKNKLLGHLAKGCVTESKDTDPLEQRVTKDKVAICVADFNKTLADELFDYQTKLKAIKDQWADAENKWVKAEISYHANICSAKAAHKQSVAAAEVVWRTKISEQLKQFCK